MTQNKMPKQCGKFNNGMKPYCGLHKNQPNKPGDAEKYGITLVAKRAQGDFANMAEGRVYIPGELKELVNEILECKDHKELARKFGPAIFANLVDLATNAPETMIRAKLNMFLQEQLEGKARERLEISGELRHSLGMIYLPRNETNVEIIDMDTDIEVLEADTMELMDNNDK
jgi:hypothetical protein